MAQTGRFFNITRERVRQILNTQGITEHSYPLRLKKVVDMKTEKTILTK